MNAVLGRYGISVKLFSVVGFLIAVVAGLGAIAYFNVDRIGGEFAEYRQNARTSIGLAEAQDGFLSARLGVMRYRATEADGAIADVENGIARMDGAIAELDGIVTDAEILSELAGARDQGARYLATFQEALVQQRVRNEIASEMDSLGPEVRRKLSQVAESAYGDGDAEAAYYAGSVQEALMLGRLYASKYLVANALSDADRAVSELDTALTRMNTLQESVQNPARRALVAQIGPELTRYRDLIGDVRATIVERNRLLTDGLDEIGPVVMGTLVELTDQAIDNQNTIGPLASAMIQNAKTTMAVIAIVAVLLGALVGWVIARHVRGGIASITDAMNAVAGGKLETVVPHTEYRDEIGDMAKALQVFKANAEQVAQQEEREREQAARAAEEKKAAMAALAEKFERQVGVIVSEVSAAAVQLRSTSTQLSAAVSETTERTDSASTSVQRASSNVQAMAAATEELAAGIEEVARTVSVAAETARSSADGAERAGSELKTLRDSIAEVDAIIASINEVAEQTNLLALNATIEAARAGEAGKGFTVVANEVKGLAAQTKQMTDGIAEKVTAVKEAAFRAIGATETIIEDVKKIDQGATTMSASVEEQSSATNEISRNAQEAAVGTSDAEQNVVSVRGATDQTRAATEEVASAADLLTKRSDDLKREVDAFLTEVRTAA
jgi:methyl-accepting chemotaxis protein